MIAFDFLAEEDAKQRRANWRRAYRWAAPPQECWLSLDGEITPAMAQRLMAAVDNCTEDAPLTLIVNSPGGDVLSALDLYGSLRRRRGPVTTCAHGICHSAALMPFLAGDVRIAAPDARFLIHSAASQPNRGRLTAAHFRASAEELAEVDRTIRDLICVRTGWFLAWRAAAAMAAESEFTAHEALQNGLVTHIGR